MTHDTRPQPTPGAPAAPAGAPVTGPDPRRWVTLGVLVTTVVLVAMDTSVLNVSIPTMLRDLDTTVPSLEWVIAGYSLTFASLLIIGGRLGDIHGHRRLFVIGASLFGIGSLIAGLSPNVGTLIVGEAVIEGMGAALMVPSTLALISGLFHGHERATAFAAWGAAAGAAVAFGPVLGGWLTTNHSWRWAFGINVVLAPLAVLGALVLVPRTVPTGRRLRMDLPGAALIASGMFCVVFALSQGPTYGWVEPREALSVGGLVLWPDTMPVSVVVVALVVGLALLAGFVAVERRKEQAGDDPLFELSQLRYPTFRYGLIASTILSLGQLGMLFALPLFLQGANDLSAQENGMWLLPFGLAIVAAAQLAGRLHRRFGTTNLVRAGLFIEVVGLVMLIPVVRPGVTFWQILPGLVVFGAGMGFASAQLTNVVLSQIPAAGAGAASGANSTSRQLGAALGAAMMGSLLTMQTTNATVDAVNGAGLPADVTTAAVDGVHAMGANWQPPAGTPDGVAATLTRLFDDALGSGARLTLVFSALVVLGGALLSLLIPQVDRVAVEVPVLAEEPLARTG